MGRFVYGALSLFLAAFVVVIACTGPDRLSPFSGGASGDPDRAALERLTAEEEAFPDIPRMTIDELAPRTGEPGLMVLDVRPQEQWLISDKKIRGAIHQNPETVESWAGAYDKGSTLVLYCA